MSVLDDGLAVVAEELREALVQRPQAPATLRHAHDELRRLTAEFDAVLLLPDSLADARLEELFDELLALRAWARARAMRD